MSEQFHQMEESLKEFLNDAQNDSYNSRTANLYKYNNLKVFMDPHKIKTPHFVIRIGISEAVYDIEKGEKISGGVGSDERLIRRWFDKNMGKFDLKSAWKQSSKPKSVSMKSEDD
jgi:hypothetical protein